MNTDEFRKVWQGRVDIEDGDLGLRIHQVVQPFSCNSNSRGFTLLGFESDLGVKHNQGRTGARHGPSALRTALANMAWHLDTPIFDAGNISTEQFTDDDPLALAQSQFADSIASILEQRQFAIGLGGGHEIAWGSYQGCQKFIDAQGHKSRRIGIINFDAHFDLRKPAANANWAGSSGTPFFQVSNDRAQRQMPFDYACLGISESANTKALFKYAYENEVRYLLDTQCSIDRSIELLDSFIGQLDYLYLTVCLDALPSAIAPGVSAPASYGISLDYLITMIQEIKILCDKSKVTWLMADIAELNPKYDIDNRTAKVAARIIYETIKVANKN